MPKIAISKQMSWSNILAEGTLPTKVEGSLYKSIHWRNMVISFHFDASYLSSTSFLWFMIGASIKLFVFNTEMKFGGHVTLF